MTLRVVEIYPSFQGEGPNTGKPTVFIRFAGCNLKCPGWPCDTQHAIDPKIFTKEQKPYTPAALVAEAAYMGPSNFCLTGGEVFLQPIEDLECLVAELQKIHTPVGSRPTVEIFTNGTLPISRSVIDKVTTFILDWKLPGSGEDIGGAWSPDSNLWTNIKHLGPKDAIKFTIKDRRDFDKARDRYDFLLSVIPFGGVVYCGPVWGALEAAELAEWMLEAKLPWNLNIQSHKYIWHPDARRT